MSSCFNEIMQIQKAVAERRRARSIALNCIKLGKMTLEDIAECTELSLAEVKRLAQSLELDK